jgi:hypothetical protein
MKGNTMNNTQKIAVVMTVTSLAVVGYLSISKDVTLNRLYERYPDLDKKIAKRAYRKMLGDAITGKLNTNNWSEEQFNDKFLNEYALMQTRISK